MHICGHCNQHPMRFGKHNGSNVSPEQVCNRRCGASLGRKHRPGMAAIVPIPAAVKRKRAECLFEPRGNVSHSLFPRNESAVTALSAGVIPGHVPGWRAPESGLHSRAYLERGNPRTFGVTPGKPDTPGYFPQAAILSKNTAVFSYELWPVVVSRGKLPHYCADFPNNIGSFLL